MHCYVKLHILTLLQRLCYLLPGHALTQVVLCDCDIREHVLSRADSVSLPTLHFSAARQADQYSLATGLADETCPQ